MQFRIVSALKESNADKNESGYDPIKMLKQNAKKIHTDEDNEALMQENLKEKHNKTKSSTASDEQKQTCHLNDESDNDETVNYTASMKKKKKVIKYSNINKKSVSEAESIQDGAQDRQDENKSRRQTILLSATLTRAVEKLADLTMRNPIFVDAAKENLEMSGGDIGQINEDLIVPQSVTQSYIVTPPKLRMVTLSAYIVKRCQVRNTSSLRWQSDVVILLVIVRNYLYNSVFFFILFFI